MDILTISSANIITYRPYLNDKDHVRTATLRAQHQGQGPGACIGAPYGQPINRLVELALERYDNELRQQSHPLDAVWELAAEGRRDVLAGTTSAHDDLYDEDGLPK